MHGHLSETKVDKDKPNSDEMDLPNDLSSIQSQSQSSKDLKPSIQFSGSDIAKLQEKSGTSYYVKDDIKPLKKHQDNIEKLLGQFRTQQSAFLDAILSEKVDESRHQSSVKTTNLSAVTGRSSAIPKEQVKALKLSFSSIDEIERLRRESNIYRETQRNSLGVAKSSLVEGKRRMKWIDLFNIGNVMLMRGLDIQ